jgi:hypothetical protein
LKSLRLKCTVPADVNEHLGNLFWGCLSVAAGALTLYNLDAVVRFDQNSGARVKTWLSKKPGKPVLNRELWSGGSQTGFRSSRIVFRTVAVLAILFGVVLIGLAFRTGLH